MTYYNTTHREGKELAEYEGRAVRQEDRIMQLYLHNPGVPFSPTQVQRALGMHETPITSIRRAITNLTTSNKLVKTALTVKGPYGRPEYCWRLASRQKELFE